jgi:hypothetical protein
VGVELELVDELLDVVVLVGVDVVVVVGLFVPPSLVDVVVVVVVVAAGVLERPRSQATPAATATPAPTARPTDVQGFAETKSPTGSAAAMGFSRNCLCDIRRLPFLRGL